jgi:hypothetical protein
MLVIGVAVVSGVGLDSEDTVFNFLSIYWNYACLLIVPLVKWAFDQVFCRSCGGSLIGVLPNSVFFMVR